MDKGIWENIQRSLVPSSMLNAKNSGAGILGPAPAPRDGFGNHQQQQQQQVMNFPPGMRPVAGGSPPFGIPHHVVLSENQSSFNPAGMPPGAAAALMAPPPPPLPPPPPPPAAGTRAAQSFQRSNEGQSHFHAPPPSPRNTDMIHVIEILAAVVAKYGSQHESVAKKQFGNPKFTFLFGGEPGSDAALGLQYYEWKKDALTRVVDAGKAVVEGKLRPDHLKAMERELEHFSYGKPVKAAEIRPDLVASLFDHGQRTWPSEVEDGHRRSHFEAPENDKNRRNGVDDSRKDSKKERQRGAVRDPRRDAVINDVNSDPSRRRRRSRSRSPAAERGRHRSPRRSRSPPRRRQHRSHSRSPRRREQINSSRMSPPRRERGEVEDRRDMHMNHNASSSARRDSHPLDSMPYANHLPPPPSQQMSLHAALEQQQQQQGPPGFLPPENAYGRYMTMVDCLPGSGPATTGQPQQQHQQQQQQQQHQDYARLPASFPSQVVPPFGPSLSEIPAHQQQILFQQLQSMIPQGALVPASEASIATPTTGTLPLAPQQHGILGAPEGYQAAPEGYQAAQTLPVQVQFVQQQQQQQPQPQPQQHQQQQPQQSQEHQQQQQSRQHNAVIKQQGSPSNDVEMEVVEASPREEASSRLDENETNNNTNSNNNNEDSDDVHKGKNERALKFVRNAVAEFVKELLNPKWREGILSKDDFKVIAKKAVDKVIGNIQSSQIPKGPERVEKFMSLSKEKITRLVQEYIDKHAKHNSTNNNNNNNSSAEAPPAATANAAAAPAAGDAAPAAGDAAAPAASDAAGGSAAAVEET